MTRFGIDLGGSKCVAAVAGGDARVEIVAGGARRTGAADRMRAGLAAWRLLGRRFEEVEVRRPVAGVPLVAADNGDAWLELGGRPISPPEALGALLAEVGALVDARLGEARGEAVIALPPSDGHAARQALRDAAELGGVRVARLLGAAAAAVIGHGAARRPGGHFVVCDLGATHFDASIVAVDNGVVETLASAGEAVGGDDFDRRLATRFAAELRAATGRDLEADATSWALFIEEVARVKREASAHGQASLTLPGGGDAGSRVLRRTEIESWTRDLVDRLEAPLRAALRAAALPPDAPRELLVVGGAARLPAVVRKLEAVAGLPSARVVHPEELVVHGAAVYAAALDGAVDPMVAIDVTPLPVGLRAPGAAAQTVVPRFAPLPARGERVVTTVRDGQKEIAIDVVEGDGPQPRPLGRYRLSGFAPAPAGEPLFVVDFNVDGDGVVGLSARPLGAGARPTLKREPATGLPRKAVRRDG